MKKLLILMLCLASSGLAMDTQQEQVTRSLITAIENNQPAEFSAILNILSAENLTTIVEETKEILVMATQATTPEFLQLLQAHDINLKKYFEEEGSILYYQITTPETFDYVHNELRCAAPHDLLHNIIKRAPDTATYRLVKYLLENDYASATKVDSEGRTPLHYIHYWSDTTCCCEGDYKKHQQFIELLKRFDADINAQDINGNTALHLLSDTLVCPQLTNALIESDANPLIRNFASQDPVFYQDTINGRIIESETRNIILHAQRKHARTRELINHCADISAFILAAFGLYIYSNYNPSAS